MAAFDWGDPFPIGTDKEAGGGGPSIQEIKDQASLWEYAAANLVPKGRTFVCPACGSGEGPNGSPAFSIMGGKAGKFWQCFSCCAHGDILDLAGIVNGTEDKAEQIRIVCDFAGIDPGRRDGHRAAGGPIGTEVAGGRSKGLKSSHSAPEGQNSGAGSLSPQAIKKKAARPVAPEVMECREAERIAIQEAVAEMGRGTGGLDYWHGRGFTTDEIILYGLGWRWDGARGTWRGVVPWTPDPSEWRHTDRRADAGKDHKYDAPDKDKAGSLGPFGIEYIEGAEGAIWAVEGPVDALSIMAVGGVAVAADGAGKWAELATAIAESGFTGAVAIAFDNEEDPKKKELVDGYETALYDALTESGIDAFIVNDPLPDGAHDFNDLLASGRDALGSYVARIDLDARDRVEAEKDAAWRRACRDLRLVDPVDALLEVYTLSDYVEPVPTGIGTLDEALEGGLYRGVYLIGAPSSTGKTTLLVNIADNVAASGRPVLFVTIEQSANELVRKTLTRFMAETDRDVRTDTRALNRPDAREGWGAATNAAFEAACTRYADDIAPNLLYMQGRTQPSAAAIIAAAQRVAQRFGTPPVVCIDYMQLIAPMQDRDTDKQTADRNMTALRMLSRDLKTPVVVLSSLNRSSSKKGLVEMESFKESGGLEYGADVALGLQPYGMREAVNAQKESKREWYAGELMLQERAKAVRSMELVVLKQREGGADALHPAAITIDFRVNTVTAGCPGGRVHLEGY